MKYKNGNRSHINANSNLEIYHRKNSNHRQNEKQDGNRQRKSKNICRRNGNRENIVRKTESQMAIGHENSNLVHIMYLLLIIALVIEKSRYLN